MIRRLIYLIFIFGLQVFSKALTPEDAKGYTNCTKVKMPTIPNFTDSSWLVLGTLCLTFSLINRSLQKIETNRNLGNYFSFKKMPMCQFLLLLNRKDFSPS